MSLYEDSLAAAYVIVVFMAVPWALVVFPALWQFHIMGDQTAAIALVDAGWDWMGVWLVIIVGVIVIAGAILDR